MAATALSGSIAASFLPHSRGLCARKLVAPAATHWRPAAARGAFQVCSSVADEVLGLLQDVARGGVSPEDALARISAPGGGGSGDPVADFAILDHERAGRTGFPEVVWGQDKTPAQIAAILQRLAERQEVAMATRVSPEAVEEVQKLCPHPVEYNAAGRVATYRLPNPSVIQPKLPGRVLLLTAGTADLPVAEECRMTLEVMGCDVRSVNDVGVAGLGRLLARLDDVRAADVIVVAAGMDGALPSVVAGLVEAPVVAVPTSVGYGAAMGGVAPLLSMLNSCATGLAVVNIDNGFGAAMVAAKMCRKMARVRGGKPR